MAHQEAPSRRQVDERGAVLVEFALILPLFMTLILGMFTGGLAYMQKISMEDGVREGARFGSTMETFNAAVVMARVAELSGELTAGQVCAELVTVPSPPNTTTGTGDCGIPDPSGSAGQEVVKVRGDRTSQLNLLVTSRTLDLRSQAIARYER